MKTELELQQWPIEKLIPYARNPRRNDDHVDRMASAIKEFGFKVPILAKSDGMVIDGHLRLKAARKLGIEMVPVVLADDLSEAQIKAFRLLANKSVEWADWDEEMLRAEFEDLQVLGFDLEKTGFESSDIRALLNGKNPGLTDPDAVPAIPDKPITRTGDLWILGNHRLLCGSSIIASDVERCLGGVKPNLMVTDPPYGVEYDASWRAAVNNDGPNSKRAIGKVANDGITDWSPAWVLFHGDVAYVWHAGGHASEVQRSLEVAGFNIRCQIIWAKSQIVFGRGDYHWQHEPCWYAIKKSGKGHWSGDRKQTTLWQIDKPRSSETGHSTQKPVECMKRPIENNSSPGQAVYDPFLGSGTTIIAAEMTGRSCLGLEIEPKYCDVIVKRWEDFTGKKAVMEKQ